MANTNNDLSQKLDDCAQRGDLLGVASLLALGADARNQASKALCLAAENGHLECVKILIPASCPMADYSRALSLAASHGHVECVKLLIPVSDPKADGSQALRWATCNGHAACVKILIPVSDPRAFHSDALLRAAIGGHAECLKLLIPVSDPMADDSRALRWAAAKGKAECFEMLIPVSEPMIEMPDFLTDVFAAGFANILSIMFAREPRFLAALDLVRAREAAKANCHPELAALISSIIEQKALAENLPLSEAICQPTIRRL